MAKRKSVLSAGSFFGWLDFDASEAKLARELLAAGSEAETQDAIGLGLVRDHLADSLFPGISTIQTRARYFLIVPWVCQLAERDFPRHSDPARRMKDLEREVIGALLAPGPDGTEADTSGVMGARSGRALKRMPSEVYWNGLETFGIRRRVSGRSITHGMFADAVRNLARRQPRLEDDEDTGEPAGLWDPGLPGMPDGFPDAPCDIGLTKAEAEYVRDRMQLGEGGGAADPVARSLLAPLLRTRSAYDDRTAFMRTSFPWEVQLVGIDDDLAQRVEHARCFSEIMWGAQLLYNDLLQRATEAHSDLNARQAATVAKNRTTIDAKFAEWILLMQDRHDELSAWHADSKTWKRVLGTSVGGRDESFIDRWCKSALADPALMRKQPAARKLVIEREYDVKRTNARLASDGSVAKPVTELYGFARLSYRWPNVKNIVRDIADAMEEADAES